MPRPSDVGRIGLTAEPVIEAASHQQCQHTQTDSGDCGQNLPVGVGVDGHPHRIAQGKAVGGAQRDIDRDALSDADFDGDPQRQVARWQFLNPDIGHRHPGWGVDLEAHPDRHGEVVA